MAKPAREPEQIFRDQVFALQCAIKAGGRINKVVLLDELTRRDGEAPDQMLPYRALKACWREHGWMDRENDKQTYVVKEGISVPTEEEIRAKFLNSRPEKKPRPSARVKAKPAQKTTNGHNTEAVLEMWGSAKSDSEKRAVMNLITDLYGRTS